MAAVLVASVVVAGGAGAASAAVICVPDATPGGCNSTKATINAAVTDAATVDGDTIRIAAGTYNESIDTGKRLRFEGAGSTPPEFPGCNTLRRARARAPP